MKLRARRARMVASGLVAVATALTSAAVGLVSPAANAGPQTKWYAATVGQTAAPTTPTVLYTLPPLSTQTLFLQIANSPNSNQSFGSADIDLIYDWSWSNFQITTSNGVESGWTPVSGFDSHNNHLIHLRNVGVGTQYAIPPGDSLTVALTFTRSTPGIDAPGLVVKQSNDFSDSSTRNTSNVFGTQAPSPAIWVGTGPPSQLIYSQNPSDVQMTSTATGTHYMCPPVKAAVEDSFGNVVTWLPATAVGLSSTGTPGLNLNGSTTLSTNTVNGVATFGTGNTTDGCTAGLTAANQGSYALTASTTVAAGAGYTGGTFSTPAAGYNVYLAPCGASCNVDLPSGTDTGANVIGTNGPTGNTPLFGAIVATGTLPSGCAKADISRPERTDVLLDAHDKSVTLAWSKKVTNSDPRNGTPFWPVCIQGPYQVYGYVSGNTGAATLRDATGGAILALCSSTGITLRSDAMPDHACISNLYKNAASEHAVIWVPDQPGDPHFI